MGRWHYIQKGHGNNATALGYAMRTATSALPRENRRGRCDGFFGICRKGDAATGAMRTAGDGDRLQRAQGSEPALKPERPETKEKASEGRFRRKRASGAVLGRLSA